MKHCLHCTPSPDISLVGMDDDFFPPSISIHFDLIVLDTIHWAEC